MKKVAVTGITGMLGSMVYNILKDRYRLIIIYKDAKKLGMLEKVYGKATGHKKILFDFEEIYSDYLEGFPKNKISPALRKLVQKIGDIDGIVNCAGIINKYASVNPVLTYFMNASLPHLLSSVYKEKLIHISTDCVFNGFAGHPYDENSPHTPTDLYGITKSLGEPDWQSLVLRTSLVGPEIANHASILEWFRRQKEEKVKGYTNHMWNGITSRQFACIIQKIIDKRDSFPKNGLFHIFSNVISKYEMLKIFRKKYGLNTTILPYKANPAIDRRLSSRYNLCDKLNLPSFEKMVEEL